MLSLPQAVGSAVLGLTCIARCPGRYHRANAVASCTAVPFPYLSKLLHLLGQKGLVDTKRGYRGGFALARPASEITLLEIAEAVWPGTNDASCLLGLATCRDESPCPAHEWWKLRRQQLYAFLQSATLEELAAHDWAARNLVRIKQDHELAPVGAPDDEPRRAERRRS